MSGQLKPDRQFDLSGGVDENASRFKTAQNGLFDCQDFYPVGGGLSNVRDVTLLSGGNIGNMTNPHIVPYSQEGKYIVVFDNGANTLYKLGDETHVTSNAGSSLGGRPYFLTWDRMGSKAFVGFYDHAVVDSALLSLSDGGVLTNFTSGGGVPTVYTLFVIHKGYGFVINKRGTAAGSNNRYSVQWNLRSWPVLSDFDIGMTNDEVFAAASFKGNLYEFKQRETWVVTGDGPGDYASGGLADFRSDQISPNIGTLFHHSIQEINGRLWMATNEGVSVFDGQRFESLSERLDLELWPRGLHTGWAFFNVFCGSYYDAADGLYYLFSPYSNNARDRRQAYIFDVKTGRMFKSAVHSGSSTVNRQTLRGIFLSSTASTTNPRRRRIFARRDEDNSKCEIFGAGSLFQGDAVLETGFKHWGAPELPKWPNKIQLFANPEASFSSGVIANEDQSVSVGAISVPASGIATIPIPQSLNGGGNFYGLKLTTNAVECKIDGIVFWGHVGDAPREET